MAVASTGVIGVPLDTDKVIRGIADARRELARRRRRATSARRSAPPTRSPRTPRSRSQLPSGTVRLCAQAKGAGMISPAFATMLCFVETDAALEAETADLLLGVCVKRSFDRISVDGQLSTNDTAILMASGASGVRIEPESEDELRFGEALDYLLRRIALQIARDGEGAARVGRVVVHGGHEESVVRAAARGGRLAAGEGGAARRRPQLGPDRAGGRRRAARHRAAAARHLDRGRPGLPRGGGDAVRRVGARRARWRGDEVEYSVGLPGEGAEAEVFFSDLSHDYVTINAEYTT